MKLTDPKWVKSYLFLPQLANIWLGFWISSFFFLVYMKQTVLGKENNSLLPV